MGTGARQEGGVGSSAWWAGREPAAPSPTSRRGGAATQAVCTAGRELPGQGCPAPAQPAGQTAAWPQTPRQGLPGRLSRSPPNLRDEKHRLFAVAKGVSRSTGGSDSARPSEGSRSRVQGTHVCTYGGTARHACPVPHWQPAAGAEVMSTRPRLPGGPHGVLRPPHSLLRAPRLQPRAPPRPPSSGPLFSGESPPGALSRGLTTASARPPSHAERPGRGGPSTAASPSNTRAE